MAHSYSYHVKERARQHGALALRLDQMVAKGELVAGPAGHYALPDIVTELRAGCVQRAADGSVDEQATDRLLARAADEILRLRARR